MSTPQTPFTPVELAMVAIQMAGKTGKPPQEFFSAAHSLLRDAASFIENPPASHESDAETSFSGWDKCLTIEAVVGRGGLMNWKWKSRQALVGALKRWQSKGLIAPKHVARIQADGVNHWDVVKFKTLLEQEKNERADNRHSERR